MNLEINDENKCNFCSANWQADGYCKNGHPNLAAGVQPLNPIKIIENLKKQISERKGLPQGVSLTIAEAEVILLSIEQLFPDNCEVCHGKRGGVRGNENIVDGKRVCDYCSVEVDENENNTKNNN